MPENQEKLINNRYRLIEKIGQGGMGVVFRGEDTFTGDAVAVKQILPRTGTEAPEDVVKRRARFRREGIVLQKLRHQYIIAIYDVILEDDTDSLVMEFITGGDLDDYIQQHPDIEEDTVLELGIKLAQGFQYAHERNVLHRDIKPANVLLDAAEDPRITDFGIARILDENFTRISQQDEMIGTLAYMSPEALQGEPLSESADVWSYGLLLYELLTGYHPFYDGSTPIFSAILMQPMRELPEHLLERWHPTL